MYSKNSMEKFEENVRNNDAGGYGKASTKAALQRTFLEKLRTNNEFIIMSPEQTFIRKT